jgi:hypothetical protein
MLLGVVEAAGVSGVGSAKIWEEIAASRALRQLGHEPRIIPAIYVKPFAMSQKLESARPGSRPHLS